MARTPRDPRLESRTARLKLEAGKYYWKLLMPGLALGYRRAARDETISTWAVRYMSSPRPALHHVYLNLTGRPDDFVDPDGVDVIDYRMAISEAHKVYAEFRHQQRHGTPGGPYTVADALADYMRWFALHRKSTADTQAVIDAHITPAFGPRPVADLTSEELRQWLEQLAMQPARVRTPKGRSQQTQAREPRARKATANRIWTVLRAALNRAWLDGKVTSNSAWARVKPFAGVNAPRTRFLTEAEAADLVTACSPDLRPLVTAALLTGARYGELIALTTVDFDAASQTLYIADSKSGKPRHIPLTAQGIELFAELSQGKAPRDWLFLRADGLPWNDGHQHRPLGDACYRARIDPPITFHVLRHTYASRLAAKGVALQVIASVLGHGDVRVTQQHYAHLQPDYVADTIRAALPDLAIDGHT